MSGGGPAGGLMSCGDMVLPGEKQASGPCRPSMAAGVAAGAATNGEGTGGR
jgi:hypothetical protein